jgi:protein ImuA
MLSLKVLKRRGPPLEKSLLVPLPPVLGEAARQRAMQPFAAWDASASDASGEPALQSATFINLA